MLYCTEITIVPKTRCFKGVRKMFLKIKQIIFEVEN